MTSGARRQVAVTYSEAPQPEPLAHATPVSPQFLPDHW